MDLEFKYLCLKHFAYKTFFTQAKVTNLPFSRFYRAKKKNLHRNS